jgi:hypothetical protein
MSQNTWAAVHTAGFADDVFRIFDVWGSEDHHRRFQDQRLTPIIEQAMRDGTRWRPAPARVHLRLARPDSRVAVKSISSTRPAARPERRGNAAGQVEEVESGTGARHRLSSKTVTGIGAVRSASNSLQSEASSGAKRREKDRRP